MQRYTATVRVMGTHLASTSWGSFGQITLASSNLSSIYSDMTDSMPGAVGQVTLRRSISNSSPMLSDIKEIKSPSQWDDIKAESSSSNKSILLNFTAAWCPPCRMIAPVLQKLAKEHSDRILFCKIDIDAPETTGIVADHAVSAVPTFVGFDATGSIVNTFSGADKTALDETIGKLLVSKT